MNFKKTWSKYSLVMYVFLFIGALHLTLVTSAVKQDIVQEREQSITITKADPSSQVQPTLKMHFHASFLRIPNCVIKLLNEYFSII